MSFLLSFPASLLVFAACFGLAGAVFPDDFVVDGNLNSKYLNSQPITDSDTAGNSANFRPELPDWPVNSEFLSPLSSQSKQTAEEIETASSPSTTLVHKCKLCAKTFKTVRGVLVHVGRMHKGETSSRTEGCADKDIRTTSTTTTATTTTTTTHTKTNNKVVTVDRTGHMAGTNSNN